MTSFLACYDYGTGGVWLYIPGDSAEQLRAAHPKLIIFDTPPSWWSEGDEARTRKCDPATSPFWADWLEKLDRDG